MLKVALKIYPKNKNTLLHPRFFFTLFGDEVGNETLIKNMAHICGSGPPSIFSHL